jgi:hypothetical protein
MNTLRLLPALIVALPMIAAAQANTYPSSSSSQAVFRESTGSGLVESNCPQVTQSLVGATSATLDCSVTSATMGQVWNPATGRYDAAPLNAGDLHATSTTATAPGGPLTSVAHMDGTANGGMSGSVNATSFTYTYVTISNPADVFKIALTPQWDLVASATGGGAEAVGYMATYTVDATGRVSYAGGMSQASVGAGDLAAGGTYTCGSFGPCVNGTSPFDIELAGTALNPNGVFAVALQSYSFAGVWSSSSSARAVDGAASATLFLPAIKLYAKDANGMLLDVTAEHSISFDPSANVTATPEPASIALLATGMFGVGGVARRRKKAPAAPTAIA